MVHPLHTARVSSFGIRLEQYLFRGGTPAIQQHVDRIPYRRIADVPIPDLFFTRARTLL